MHNKNYVYLAGSIPESNTGSPVHHWRSTIDAMIKTYNLGSAQTIIIFDPGKGLDADLPIYARFGRCAQMIYQSDAVIVSASDKIGIGTSQEMMIAHYYGKPVIVIAPPDTYYNKFIMNNKNQEVPYLHPFIQASADSIVDDEDQAIAVFIDHITEKKILTAKPLSDIERLRVDYEQHYLTGDAYFVSQME